MRKKRYKSSRGAISVFVLMSMLFFLFATIGIFSIISKRAQTQTESIVDLKSKYYVEGIESQIVSNRISDSESLIPIYTPEQLLTIGTPDKTIEIDGKIYDFSQIDYSKYELKNDIIFSIDLSSTTILSETNYNALNKADYEILYYDSSTGKYYQVARENDTAVKIINDNGFKLAVKYLDAQKIKEEPTTYYGCYVNYQANNSQAANWRIFYADDDNIYLIADDYISFSYVPLGKNGNSITLTNANGFCFSTNNVIADYTGTSEISSSHPVQKWLYKYFDCIIQHLNNGYTNSNNNIRATAYMVDITQWNDFKGNRADYAIATPTLELFIASYNSTHNSNVQLQVTQVLNQNVIRGYQIKKESDENYSDSITLNYLAELEDLYFLENSNKADSMWLASPGNDSINDDFENNLISISKTGNVISTPYNSSDIGFRPIICLSAGVSLSRNQNGTYNIK